MIDNQPEISQEAARQMLTALKMIAASGLVRGPDKHNPGTLTPCHDTMMAAIARAEADSARSVVPRWRAFNAEGNPLPGVYDSIVYAMRAAREDRNWLDAAALGARVERAS